MKVPAPPPNLADIMAQVDPGRAVELISATDFTSMTDEYLSWDKMRYKTPPAGLSVEEWWLATKLIRRAVQRPVPALVDKDHEPFTYTLPDAVLKLNDEVTRGASGEIAISEQVTNTATRDRYVISSLIEEAITSSQLEGAATSRRVAKDMIRSGRPPQDRSERMIFNNYRAMRRIIELREQPMTPDLVCEIHRIVTAGTLDNPEAAGKIQDDDGTRIAVWGDGEQLLHRPPPVAELAGRLERLCEFANGSGGPGYLQPALRAISIHFMMGYDHYFEDGNGRTARALFYWSMLREGFWLTEFLTISKILKEAPARYARSFLLTEEDDGDLTHFFIFHLTVIRRAIGELHDYLATKSAQLREVQQTIRAVPGEYNHRQLAVLEHAVKNPGGLITATSHAQSHNVSEQSARNDLATLEERGLLLRTKVGRRFAWNAVDELAEKLRGHEG